MQTSDRVIHRFMDKDKGDASSDVASPDMCRSSGSKAFPKPVCHVEQWVDSQVVSRRHLPWVGGI